MKPIFKLLIIVTLLGIVAAGAIGYFFFNIEHTDLSTEKPAVVLPASQLFAEYEADEAAANSKYLNKVVEIEGVVESVEQKEGGVVVMIKEPADMFGVSCAFLENHDFSPGQKIKVRGNCTGFLMDVNLSRCVVVN